MQDFPAEENLSCYNPKGQGYKPAMDKEEECNNDEPKKEEETKK